MDTEMETRDIAFAAFLISQKIEFLRVKHHGHIKYWVFKLRDGDSQEKLEADWINSEAREFYTCFQEIKQTLGERGTHGRGG